MLSRSAFPVSLLYRTLEKFNDAFNFLLTYRLACVAIDHYCFRDVQQNIVNLPLYHSATKIESAALKLLCIDINVCGALFSV